MTARPQTDDFINGITGNDPNLIYIRILKGGGSGQVHILFARKVMQLSSPTSSNAIENEARNIDLISKEGHKNLVRVDDHGHLKYYVNGVVTTTLPIYIIDMELGSGSLTGQIEKRFHNSKPPNFFRSVDVWNIMSQIAGGIEFLHRKGIIHRDLKPDNVIQSAGNPNVWKLIDFGISVLTSGNPMATQELKGTAGYVAPEILRREAYTESVDIYPIGMILFEICTGHRAFFTPEGVHQLCFSPHQIMGPSMGDVANFYATNVITKPFGPINDTVRGLLQIFWDAVKDMNLSDERLFGEVYWRRDMRVEEINRFVRVMSNDNPKLRPSMASVTHHFRANLIRSLLEYDITYREGVARAFLILNPSKNLPPRIIRRRLQFLVSVESVCAGENRLELYDKLSLLATKILVGNIIENSYQEWYELESLLPNRHDLWHDFKHSFVYDQNLTAHDLEFLKSKISQPNYDTPSDDKQLDAESPDNGRARGFYDELTDTSRTPVRSRAASEVDRIPNAQRWHTSSNSEGNIGEPAPQRGLQQLVGENLGQQIRGNEILGGPPPNSDGQQSDCWQLNGLQEELPKPTLNRYQEWPPQVGALHESGGAPMQPGDRPIDPTSVEYNVLNRVAGHSHEPSPRFLQPNVNVPGPRTTPDNEDWHILGDSAFLNG